MPVFPLDAMTANRQQRRAKARHVTLPVSPSSAPPSPAGHAALPVLPASALRPEHAVLLELYGQQPVAFHRMFVDIAGSVTAALWLSHAVALVQHGPMEEGAFTLSQEACHAATGLTRREQETARARLREGGFITEHRLRRQVTYRLDLKKLAGKLLAHSTNLWSLDALNTSTGTNA